MLNQVPSVLFALVVLIPGLRAATVSDGRHRVEVDPASGTFRIALTATGKDFLTAGRLPISGGTARTITLDDARLGPGTGIEIRHPDGRRDIISLYRGLPFVAFRSLIRNTGSTPLLVRQLPAASARVDLGIPLDRMRTLGTGGLLAPAANAGSYAFLALVDPVTRGGVVAGWLTHDRGSGIVLSPVEDGAVRVDGRIDYGSLRIAPGEEAVSEILAIGCFDDARLGLESYADAVARIHAIRLPPHRPGHCTWYMEKHAGACDEKSLVELASCASRQLKSYGLDFLQIDDHWQEGTTGNGPRKNFTTHRPDGPYPSGMKAAADSLKAQDLTPGLWFMPFAGTWNDPFFKDHQDWFARGPDGKPFDTRWGGTCLDMTHPGAQEHVRGIVTRIAKEWGYRVFKMDGFWTGSATRLMYVNNEYRDDSIGESVLSDPSKTHIEALRAGTRLVREAAGPDVFLLGCCVSQNMRSFGGSFGLLDAMRVGPDTGSGDIGSTQASRLWFLNGRVWWNDPDCVTVRASIALERARLNATFTAIADDLFYNSDWLPDLPAERIDILRRCIPSHGHPSRPVDVFEHPVARIWHVADTSTPARRDIVALYNWDDASATIDCTPDRIGLPPASAYAGFDFWADRFVPPFTGAVVAQLPAHSCRVLSLRPVASHPQVVSTSRHVTQGIIDLKDEAWNGIDHTLSATSMLIAGDPYEVRIVVPASADSWIAEGMELGTGDAAAGVRATIRQDGPRIRASITSPVMRTASWSIRFRPGAVLSTTPRMPTGLAAQVSYKAIHLTWEDVGADRYRITCSDGRSAVSPLPAFTDTGFARGAPLTYRVEALGWDGKPTDAATVAATPQAALQIPPQPPKPTQPLDAKRMRVISNGRGEMATDRNADGKALKLEGKTYATGFGLHAPATVVHPVPAGATRFVATVGLDGQAIRRGRSGSIVFAIQGDVLEMGEKPVLLGCSPILSKDTVTMWHFDLPLDARIKELRLVVTDAEDGNDSDFADLVEAGFIIP